MHDNPLECFTCMQEITDPYFLYCGHTVCHKCIPSNSSLCKFCLNKNNNNANSEAVEPVPDLLASYLIQSSKEKIEQCANCEESFNPMFFCTTCQQSLCSDCRLETHKAKMFSTHTIINSEDRHLKPGTSMCSTHLQPIILYCTIKEQLACIECFNEIPIDERKDFTAIDEGYRICVDKIEQSSEKLRLYQNEISDELNVRKRFLEENSTSFEESKKEINQLCQQIIDTVLLTRDKLIKTVEKKYDVFKDNCTAQIREIENLLHPISLCLLGGQFLCNSLTKSDVLKLTSYLIERINNLLIKNVAKTPPTPLVDNIESRAEIAKSLEPFLGLSAAWCPIRSSDGGSNSQKRSSSSSKSFNVFSKYQFSIDLAGSFGKLLSTVEKPLEKVVIELAETTQKVLDIQKDLTTRRCLVDDLIVDQMIKTCKNIETELGSNSAKLDSMQSEMQELWQEQLDRVRRQQVIYREKIKEVGSLRQTARQILIAVKQLAPYVSCIHKMNTIINPKRCHPPDPAPMESICMEISGIEPNSENRIQAIEKEEENRRIHQEAKKKEEIAEHNLIVKSLKHGKSRRKDIGRNILNAERERSPGGTDIALSCPYNKQHTTLLKSPEPSIDSDEDLLTHFFEIANKQNEPAENAFRTILLEDHIYSVLNLQTIDCNSASSPSNIIDKMLKKVPLNSRVTSDIGVCRGAMLQSLHDVFAVQRSPIPENITVSEEKNVLASAVRNAEKMIQVEKSDKVEPVGYTTKKAPVKHKTKHRKPKKTRAKESNNSNSIPDVPFVPEDLFEKSNEEKIGTFEVKERMLQSLKEKIKLDKIGNDSE